MERGPWSGLLLGEGGEADTAVHLKLVEFTGGGGGNQNHMFMKWLDLPLNCEGAI